MKYISLGVGVLLNFLSATPPTILAERRIVWSTEIKYLWVARFENLTKLTLL